MARGLGSVSVSSLSATTSYSAITPTSQRSRIPCWVGCVEPPRSRLGCHAGGDSERRGERVYALERRPQTRQIRLDGLYGVQTTLPKRRPAGMPYQRLFGQLDRFGPLTLSQFPGIDFQTASERSVFTSRWLALSVLFLLLVFLLLRSYPTPGHWLLLLRVSCSGRLRRSRWCQLFPFRFARSILSLSCSLEGLPCSS